MFHQFVYINRTQAAERPEKCRFLSLVTLTFDIWPWPSKSSERGTKHVFRVNSAQIRSAVPEIFHTQLECGPVPNVMVALPWRPLFKAAKFGWRPLLECRAVTLPRRKTHRNLQACPKLANRSQPLVGRSSPYYEDMWRRCRCLTNFFPIVDACLSCEDTVRQSCVMVPKWRLFASCIFSEPRAAHFRHAF